MFSNSKILLTKDKSINLEVLILYCLFLFLAPADANIKPTFSRFYLFIWLLFLENRRKAMYSRLIRQNCRNIQVQRRRIKPIKDTMDSLWIFLHLFLIFILNNVRNTSNYFLERRVWRLVIMAKSMPETCSNL